MKKYLNEINRKGYIVLNSIYSKKETSEFKKRLEKILIKRVKKNKKTGSPLNQVMWNYFNEDSYLLKLIYNQRIDRILKKLLDENYVLQSSVAQNRLIKKNKNNHDKGVGNSWHTDSRYLAGKRIEKGFSYLVIVALDEFNKVNGSTKFIPTSLNETKIPPRIIPKKHTHLIHELNMSEGSVCIMDTGLWHKAGKSSVNSRWSIFNIYSGWFVKPYFNYKPLYKKKINNVYKKLLHMYSTPPEMNENRTSTVIKFKH